MITRRHPVIAHGPERPTDDFPNIILRAVTPPTQGGRPPGSVRSDEELGVKDLALAYDALEADHVHRILLRTQDRHAVAMEGKRYAPMTPVVPPLARVQLQAG